MKKLITIALSIVAVLGIALGVVYAIDMNRMKNNEPVFFSTWGRKYAPSLEESKSGEYSGEKSNSEVTKNESGEEKTFIATVLEETTKYMIVEPSEGSTERKSADKIMVTYNDGDHIDYLYGIGRKVIIKYNGEILETYPAKIKSDEILINGYEDFEISVKESAKTEKKKILNNKELSQYSQDYDLYYYGLEEVNVKVNGKEMPLETALREGYITLNGLIIKANKDFPDAISYDDGGTLEYHYENYTIIKCHKLDGNRDVYIGTKNMNLNTL